MNIYLVKQHTGKTYDYLQSEVIIANNKDEAIRLFNSYENFPLDKVTCRLIGHSLDILKRPVIICTDFIDG